VTESVLTDCEIGTRHCWEKLITGLQWARRLLWRY